MNYYRARKGEERFGNIYMYIYSHIYLEVSTYSFILQTNAMSTALIAN